MAKSHRPECETIDYSNQNESFQNRQFTLSIHYCVHTEYTLRKYKNVEPVDLIENWEDNFQLQLNRFLLYYTLKRISTPLLDTVYVVLWSCSAFQAP